MKTRWILSLFAVIFLFGCDEVIVSEDVKIQVNVPDEPYHGTRTKVVTLDVQNNREAFYDFFKSAKKVGMCSPTKIESDCNAREVMTVSFSGGSLECVKTFYILKNQADKWITTGYGGVEVYDVPKGFPEYKYSDASLEKLKLWYEQNVPEKDEKK